MFAYSDVNTWPKFTDAFNLHSSHPALNFNSSHWQNALNPEVKGLKAFTAIKKARLILRSIFRKHVHAWWTNIIIFGLPCWYSTSCLSGLLLCVVQLKMERGTSACMTAAAARFCAAIIVIGARASSRVISSPVVTFARHPLVLTCFYPTKTQLRNCCRLQKGTSVACSHNAAPSLSPCWTWWTELRLVPARQFVSSVLPCATNLAEHDQQSDPEQTQGVSCATTDPLHAQAPLCPGTNEALHLAPPKKHMKP